MPKPTAPRDACRAVQATDRLVVERVTELADLLRLAPDWDDLLDEDSVGAPFRSAAWLMAWWQHFAHAKSLRAYTVWNGPVLVGLLPAYQVQTPLGSSQLRLLGDRGIDSDYVGLVSRAHDAALVSQALARALLSAERDLAFDGLDGGEVFTGALQRAATDAGASCSRDTLASCPFLSVERAGDYAQWLSARPTRVGPRLAASQRWLAKQPGVRMDVLSRPADLVGAASDFWRLHHARWASEGGSDAIYDAQTAAFHAASLPALAQRGWARLYLLYVDGQPCAGLYGFAHGRRFAYYQGGFDPRFHQRSLGMVVLNAALRDAFEGRLAEFDFLRGEESYKLIYATSTRQLASIQIASGPRGRASFTVHQAALAARGALRAVVPTSVVRWVRRVGRGRRQWSPPRA